jgi:pimeloyl-ACP methyl ester carboxylesterase
MANFVLVHGTGHGGWCWQKVARLLRAGGHEVYTPTLTGLSDRSHLVDWGVNLTTHITDVTNLLFYEDISEVLLVGHSYAGMVITGVAARVPERLRLLVYLDAYVPDDGQSEAELWPAEMRAEIEADEAAGSGLRPPPDPVFLGLSDPEMAAWAKQRITPQPLATYTEPVPAGNAQSAALPRGYIHCTAGPTTSLFGSFAAKARSRGWEMHEIATGHDAMLTAPRELVEILLKVAGQASQ